MATQHDLSFLKELGLDISKPIPGCFDGTWYGNGEITSSKNPANLQTIGQVQNGTKEDYERAISKSQQAFKVWASMPAPKRGEIVRQIGDEFRKYLDPLGKLLSMEVGKIFPEAKGEIQELIDICDYAVGLSRMMNGIIVPSEREGHFLMEAWNPLGMIGIISAFNFPVAVFGWNAAISLVCGNCQVWKGAPSTPLITIATSKILHTVFQRNNLPPEISAVVLGGADIGELISNDKRLSLVSFTGSCAVGKKVRDIVEKRTGKCLLELGGNNAITVMDDANLDLAVRGAFFAAVGTCGQRCTSCRRILLHEKVYDEFLSRLMKAYDSVTIGDPLDSNTLCGPLHSENSIQIYENGLKAIQEQGGKILRGNKVLREKGGLYVEPTIVEITHDKPIVQQELFVPIVYVIKVSSLEQAIQLNNSVSQGLSSSLFSTNQASLFHWTGPFGADTGIVNVNIGTSGAEIGLAFGGEKETGGGREAGSDSWKQYCRRATCTINYSKELPLAQGINFGN